MHSTADIFDPPAGNTAGATPLPATSLGGSAPGSATVAPAGQPAVLATSQGFSAASAAHSGSSMDPSNSTTGAEWGGKEKAVEVEYITYSPDRPLNVTFGALNNVTREGSDPSYNCYIEFSQANDMGKMEISSELQFDRGIIAHKSHGGGAKYGTDFADVGIKSVHAKPIIEAIRETGVELNGKSIGVPEKDAWFFNMDISGVKSASIGIVVPSGDPENPDFVILDAGKAMQTTQCSLGGPCSFRFRLKKRFPMGQTPTAVVGYQWNLGVEIKAFAVEKLVTGISPPNTRRPSSRFLKMAARHPVPDELLRLAGVKRSAKRA